MMGMNGGKADKSATIDRILEAAQKEFARSGFATVHVNQIARSAGVSAKLIYHYFGKKENLYLEALTQMAIDFFAAFQLEAPSVDDPLLTIRQFALRYADFYILNPHVGRLLIDQVIHDGEQIKRSHFLERRRDEMLEPLKQAMAQGCRQGIIRPDISAEGLFFHALIVTLGYVSISGLLGQLHLDVPELRTEQNVREAISEAIVSFALAR
ncbi:AcrR family transcriptional regulator [Novosphingobium lubricantis]|uniref:AcrR family transcriptional regulator n=1 Tax=Sphingobium fontiphilum TaxID=944425 RepID=A0A7W6GRI5_9SPHN|nr:TetR/AcrR family transcriptional regulator [Sphingobium fontiphilum]MBB3983119.1 AcrR family transcriptional regulator [Sphingobium fontiphilum]